MNKINIYEVDGIWVAAATIEDAMKEFISLGFEEADFYVEGELIIQELADNSYDKFRFVKDDGTVCTFEEQLNAMIAAGVQFPAFFAHDNTY